jgi:hypothetical protein
MCSPAYVLLFNDLIVFARVSGSGSLEYRRSVQLLGGEQESFSFDAASDMNATLAKHHCVRS